MRTLPHRHRSASCGLNASIITEEMELRALICPICGQPLDKDGDEYRCRYCAHSFEAAHDDLLDALSSKLEADKIERLSNARRLLYDATHRDRHIAPYPVKDAVVNASRAVLSIKQDEPFALVALHSYDADPYALVQIISSLTVEKGIADDIFNWLLPALSPRLLGPLNDFVCRHYKNEERTKRLNALEEEADKIDEGTYVHTLSRDVFLAYSSADMGKVLEIIDALEENGLTVFAAFRNLRHGKGAAENYLSSIEAAMRACSCFVFLSSDSSRQMACDAMKVELPYLTSSLVNKPRIEYILSDYPDRIPFMVRHTLKKAFPYQEQCRDPEDLVKRVYDAKSAPISSLDEEALRKQIEEETRKSIEEENAKKLEEAKRKVEEETRLRLEEENRKRLEEVSKKRIEEEPKPLQEHQEAVEESEPPKEEKTPKPSQKAEPKPRQKDKLPTPKIGPRSYNALEWSITSKGKLRRYKGKSESPVIPGFVTAICYEAFASCPSIRSIEIPPSVTSIGEGAFQSCVNLTSISIPPYVKEIGDRAFANCPALEEIKVDPDNKVYDSRKECNAIVETAGKKIIAGCKNTKVPYGIASIGDYAFYGCRGLGHITIPASVTSISDSAFGDCPGVNVISVSAGNPVYDSRKNCNAIIETKTNKLIVGCKDTVIPRGVVSIGPRAFEGCTALTSVSIPSSVASIDVWAFFDCHALSSISLPSSLKSIGARAFSNCFALSSISLPPTLSSIGPWAFYNCKALSTLAIPPSVTSIGNYAFEGCTCSLRLLAAKKRWTGKIRYPKGYSKDFLFGFQGKVVL